MVVKIVAKTGRKNVYETTIKPRFDDIAKWLQSGATEKQIASNLGVAESTWFKYKAAEQEFSEFLKNGRQKLVIELRGALVNRAMGFHYYEETEVKELDKEINVLVTTKKERRKRYAAPDVAALNLCLKNYDKENWSNDPRSDDFKREELEMKKKALEENNW